MSGTAESPWPTVPLGELVTMLSGGTPSKQRAANWVGTVPWASPKDMKRLYLPDTEDHISEEAAEELTIVPTGTVLVVVRGMILAKTVPVCRIEVPMTFNQDMKALVVRDAKRIDQEFLLYALDHARDEIPVDRAAHGTCKLNTEMLVQVRIALPPLAVQCEVAGVLKVLRQALERSTASLRSVENLMQSVRTDAIEMGLSACGAVPLGSIIRGTPQNGLYKHASFYGHGVSILRINDFGRDGDTVMTSKLRVACTPDEIDTYGVAEGDVLVNRVNSLSHIGKAAIVGALQGPMVFESNMMRLEIDSDHALASYVLHALCSPRVRRQLASKAKPAVAQVSINQGDVRSVTIPLPPLDEQRRIVEILSAIDAKIDAERQRLAALEDLYRTLLHGLMTGALRVDDPAVARETAQLSLPAAPVE